MYRVFIRIEPDGDFSYENNIVGFNKDLAEIDLYYNDRDNITNDLKSFYYNLCNTISTTKEYIKGTVENIKNTKKYVDMILDVFEYFHINFEFGNQYIIIEVLPANAKDVKIQDSDDSIIIYDKGEEKFWTDYPHFSEYKIEEEWNWDKIKESNKVW